MKFRWIDILLILLGLIIVYQLIKKMMGSGWETEALIIALLIFNLGLVWKLSINVMELSIKFDGHIKWHKSRDKE